MTSALRPQVLRKDISVLYSMGKSKKKSQHTENLWDQFTARERQCISEDDRNRFPQGSRIFIGNLPGKKVTKRDIFDVFHKFGEIIEISLRSAYGFVQFQTAEEGRSVLEKLQGCKVRGRHIYLQISLCRHKSKNKHKRIRKQRRGSPSHDENKRENRESIDGLQQEKLRHEKDHVYVDENPYHIPRAEHTSRYVSGVPDVQIITEPAVSRDFVVYVERAFSMKGMNAKVTYLYPGISKAEVFHKQANDGVAIVDLMISSQAAARITLYTFDRSISKDQVQFTKYVDIDPVAAADATLAAKTTLLAGPHLPKASVQGYCARTSSSSSYYSYLGRQT